MASIVRCCRVEASNTDLQQTPTDALAEEKDKSSPQGSVGSDGSRKWGNLSTFSEDHLVCLQPLTRAEIADLLQQYAMYKQASDFSFELDAPGLADCIFETTEGFPGLVGLCCSEIDSKNILSVGDWLKWGTDSLVMQLQQQRNY